MAGPPKSKDPVKRIMSDIRRAGVLCEQANLEFGDFAFEGNGPNGLMAIGIERKTLHDMLNCIDDARYSAHQKVGMKSMYQVSILLLEGHWKSSEDGFLMEGFDDGTKWGYCRPGGKRVMYSKLYRYLMSVSLSGVMITSSRNEYQSAQNVMECFHYFQKKWENHTSLLETQKLAIPQLSGKPTLVRRWASDLEGVGVKHSIEAEHVFKTPIALAQADETEWLQVPGIGVRTAQSIVKEIQGWGR